MAYTNGYDLTSVLAKLAGRLAWRTDATLSTANKTSASGRYFDDGSFHALVTVPNIKATAPEPVSPDTWDTYFTARQNSVIAKCLAAVFNEPQYKEQVVLYQRLSELETTIPNAGKAVGYRIKPAHAFDISVQINSLELYFDGVATFNVYLFKQGSAIPVKTKEVTTVANEKTTVPLTDWILNYRNSPVYYVAYYQDDLGSVKAIQEQVCMNKTLCFSAEPFTASTTGSGFQRDNLSLSLNNPYGVNMQVSSFRDITQHILNQPHLFDELIGLTMAYQVIEDVLYSVQSSSTERILKDQMDKIGIQLELNGAAPIPDSPKVTGFRQKIEREIQQVRKAFYHKPKAQTVSLC